MIEAYRRLSNAQLPENLIEFENNRFSNWSVIHLNLLKRFGNEKILGRLVGTKNRKC